MQWTVAIGVDTDKDVHVAVALDRLGGQLDSYEMATSSSGYRSLLRWARELGEPAFAVEGTGSYGAGLVRFLERAGVPAYECERPRRQERRRGKNDLIDAGLAARQLLSGEGLSTPRGGGPREDLRLLLLERRSAVQARSAALNQLHALLVTAPDHLRKQLETRPGKRLAKSSGPALTRQGHRQRRHAPPRPPRLTPLRRTRRDRARTRPARRRARARPAQRVRRRPCLRRPTARLNRQPRPHAQRSLLRRTRRHQPRRSLKRPPATAPPQPRRRPPTQLGPPRHRTPTDPPPPPNRQLLPTTPPNRQNQQRSTPLYQTRPRPLLLPTPPRNTNPPLDNIEASDHVAIYLGNDLIIHAPRTGDVVKVTKLSGYLPVWGWVRWEPVSSPADGAAAHRTITVAAKTPSRSGRVFTVISAD